MSQRLNHLNIVKIHDRRIKRSWFRAIGAESLERDVEGDVSDEIEAPEMGQLVLILQAIR